MSLLDLPAVVERRGQVVAPLGPWDEPPAPKPQKHKRVESWGVGHPPKILSNAEARTIRKRLAAGESQVSLAKEYGVARGTIQNVKNYRTHKRA
jgi:hypothetical protein